MENKQLKEIIRNSIDLHVHVGPEIIPRKFTAESLSRAEEGQLFGAVLKNHFYPTTPFVKEVRSPKIKLFGSIVLNNSVGGLNPEAIVAASSITNGPFIVWLPTISARQFLENSEYEIAPEWVRDQNFTARKADEVSSISIFDKNGALSKKAYEVLLAVKETGGVLATGHISWEESVAVVKAAKQLGINKIIITHPIYQKIDMPITAQTELAGMGVKIEQCYSMYSIDKISIEKIAAQIKAVGAINCVLSSDVGQTFSPNPSKALMIFSKKLIKAGISLDEIKQMLVENPRFLVGP